MKKNRRAILAILGILLAILIFGIIFLANHYIKIRADFNRLESEEYDTVFFSMYPVDHYEENDYQHFRNMQIVKTSYQIPNGKVMRWYMEVANQSGNAISTVYLGIDPLRTAKEDIVILIQENPDIQFEIVPAYPEINYWLDMSETKCEKALQEYQIFAEWVTVLPNARVYFFSGEEWLICNSGNYEDTYLTNTEVSQFLMCNSDIQHSYQMTIETVADSIDKMGTLIAEYRVDRKEYPDASDKDIVFLGDSIIGNYTNSLSVPGVVEAFSGARVYNCGYGGKGAALSERTQLPLPTIVDKLVNKDLEGLPDGEQVSLGVASFVNREQTDRQLMFVINHGLNDYFDGVPLETEDAYDIGSYCGAIRRAVETLKAAYPGAQILLMTPNFTIYFGNGEEIQSQQGGKLEDYAEAVLRLADELNVDVLDNFHELPITAENWGEYQDDGCHLNEWGRFLVGSRIAGTIEE